MDAIESVGISGSLAERLRKLDADMHDAGERLKAAQIDLKPLDDLPNLIPVLVERWRALVAEFEELASNPDIEPGEIDTARGHLHALLGQVTLRSKDGVLWAHPTLKAKGLTEVSPLPLIMVAGARFVRQQRPHRPSRYWRSTYWSLISRGALPEKSLL